ncbi:MAG: hypothetical protein ABIJ21_03280 [Nanoarchaeota archaeon]
MYRILAITQHRGGGQAVAPVLKMLHKNGYQLKIVALRPSYEAYVGVDFSFMTGEPNKTRERTKQIAYNLFQTLDLDLLLTGTSSQDVNIPLTLEQAATLEARAYDIPSLAIQDMWGSHSRRYSDLPEADNRRYVPDKIAVQDTYARDQMIAEGFHPEQLVVTGNPYFDDIGQLLGEWTPEKKEEVRGKLQLASTDQVMLYGSGPINHHFGTEKGYTEVTALDELLKTMSAHDNYRDHTVVIRPHPLEKKDGLTGLQEVAAKYDIPTRFDMGEITPREAILMADTVTTYHLSTMLLESVLLGRICISLTPGLDPVEDTAVTNQQRITLPVYSHGELFETLSHINDAETRAQLIERGKQLQPDGQATQRVVQLIYDMLQ